MRIFFILLITLFSSHSYSFSLDLETITDTLEKITEELSEDLKEEETQAKEEIKTTEKVQVKEEVHSVCKNSEVWVKDKNLHYSTLNNTIKLIKAYSIVVKQSDQTIEYIFSGDDEGGTLTLINLKSNESENKTYKIKPLYDGKKIIINGVNMKIESSNNMQGEPYIQFWKDGDKNVSQFDIIGFRDQLEKIACESKNSYQVLNENINSSNQIDLVYCKYKVNYSVTKDIPMKNKKGDSGEFESYFIFTELDKGTENNKCPNIDEYNKKNFVKEIETNTINYKRITAEEFEKYNLDLKLKNSYPLGKNVKFKLPNDGKFKYEEKVFESKDLIRYCLLKHSEKKPWIKPGEPIFTLAWFSGDRDGKVWEAGCGNNDEKDEQYDKHYSKIIKVSKGKISRNDVPEYIPYHVLFEKAEKEKKAKEGRERKKKETKEAEIKEVRELKSKPEYKLKEAYVDYLVIKNINKNSFYGRSSQMNNAKKLIKMLEKHYKKQIQNNFDSLWNKAEKQYLQKFSKNINSLASRYSKQGQGIFDLYLLSLQNAADAAGVSTSNTNKDF